MFEIRMPENASHVIIHHYFDNYSDVKLISMVCCIALGVAIILILVIILIVISYIVFQRSKCKDPRPASICETLQNSRHTVANSYKRDTLSHKQESNPTAAMFDTIDLDSNPDAQNIPMTTFNPDLRDMAADSSDSSAGLCEVLFPHQSEGEIIYEPPPKLVTFAGRVYATPHGRPLSVSNSEHRATGSGNTTRHNSNAASTSLEWDYFESRRYGASNASDESRTDEKEIVDVCWV